MLLHVKLAAFAFVLLALLVAGCDDSKKESAVQEATTTQAAARRNATDLRVMLADSPRSPRRPGMLSTRSGVGLRAPRDWICWVTDE